MAQTVYQNDHSGITITFFKKLNQVFKNAKNNYKDILHIFATKTYYT